MQLFRKNWRLSKVLWKVTISASHWGESYTVTVRARGVIGAKLKALDALARNVLSNNTRSMDNLIFEVERVEK